MSIFDEEPSDSTVHVRSKKKRKSLKFPEDVKLNQEVEDEPIKKKKSRKSKGVENDVDDEKKIKKKKKTSTIDEELSSPKKEVFNDSKISKLKKKNVSDSPVSSPKKEKSPKMHKVANQGSNVGDTKSPKKNKGDLNESLIFTKTENNIGGLKKSPKKKNKSKIEKVEEEESDSDDGENIKKYNRKQNHNQESDDEEYVLSDHGQCDDDEDDEEDYHNMEDHEDDEDKNFEKDDANNLPDVIWGTRSTIQLLKNVEKQIDLTSCIFRTSIKKLVWEDIVFDNYTIDNCKYQLNRIYKKATKRLTMQDIVSKSFSLIKKKSTIFNEPKIEVYLKRPLTSYMNFQKEYLKKHKFKNMGVLNRSSIVAKAWQELSKEQKEPYIKKYIEEKSLYAKNLSNHMEQHPELYNDDRKNAKSKSCIQLYLDEKIAAHIKKYPQVKKCDIISEYKKRWRTSSDDKKLKYIKRAIILFKEYCNENQIKNPNSLKFLTIAELNIYEKSIGKPSLDFKNTFQLYCNCNTDLSKEEQSDSWKLIKPPAKAEYQRKFIEYLEEYEKKYANYVQSIPLELREDMLKKKYKYVIPKIKYTPREAKSPKKSGESVIHEKKSLEVMETESESEDESEYSDSD